jgi:hypothetical protein
LSDDVDELIQAYISEDSIQDQLKMITEGLASLHSQRNIKNLAVKKLADSIITADKAHEVCASFESEHLYQNAHGHALIHFVVAASQSLCESACADHLKIMAMAMDWQCARTAAIVFDWYSSKSHRLARELFQAQQKMDEDSFKQAYPSFYKLCNDIAVYVQKACLQYQDDSSSLPQSIKTGHNSSKKQRVGQSQQTYVQIPYKVPAHLHGLVSCSNQKSPIQLPPVKYVKSLDAQCIQSEQCFKDIISQVMLQPYLIQADQSFPIVGLRPKQDKAHHRWIVRGAVVQCIINAFGSDSIFAIDHTCAILGNAGKFFQNHKKGYERIARKIICDPSCLNPLQDKFKAHVSNSLVTCASDLGTAVWSAVALTHFQKVLPVTDFTNMKEARKKVGKGKALEKTVHITQAVDKGHIEVKGNSREQKGQRTLKRKRVDKEDSGEDSDSDGPVTKKGKPQKKNKKTKDSNADSDGPVTKKTKKKTKVPKFQSHPFPFAGLKTQEDFDSIFMDDQAPYVEQIALLCRETLNQANGLPAAEPELLSILKAETEVCQKR